MQSRSIIADKRTKPATIIKRFRDAKDRSIHKRLKAIADTSKSAPAKIKSHAKASKKPGRPTHGWVNRNLYNAIHHGDMRVDLSRFEHVVNRNPYATE